jgi:elongation factor 1-alpha
MNSLSPVQLIQEISVAVCGSVDAGKSTLVGVLTTNTLDDGKGKARSSVFTFPHEQVTGRTSAIGHRFIMDEEHNRIINFFDLCGHAKYLKTTIKGMTSGETDFALLCVGTNITDMTKEHIRLLRALKVPFAFLQTKSECTPSHILAENQTTLKKFARECNCKFFRLDSAEQFQKFILPQLQQFIPYVTVSNVTGDGLDIVKKMIQHVPKRPSNQAPVLYIQAIFKKPGLSGLICSGFSGVELRDAQLVYVGPVQNQYHQVYIKSLHNDYRQEVKSVVPFRRCCVRFDWPETNGTLKPGMIVSPTIQPMYKRFAAQVCVFGGHSTGIKQGCCAFGNVGAIKHPLVFVKVPECLRSGDVGKVELEFMYASQFLAPNSLLFLREGKLRSVARLLLDEPLDTNIPPYELPKHYRKRRRRLKKLIVVKK